MQRAKIPAAARVAALLAAGCGLHGFGQNPPAGAAAPLQPASVASLNDTLLAKATNLYASATKSGLRGFDCQVHPDWNKMMSSARKGEAIAADDPKLALLGGVNITLRARLKGDSTLEWQAPEHPEKPPDSAAASMLDRTHRGMEQTLTGVIKLWVPLVDGSVAEALGEEGADLSQTANGYRLLSKGKYASVTEEFDSNLLLKHFINTSSGTTVDIAPVFEPTQQGLLLKSFVAHVQVGAAAAIPQEIRVGIDYQTVSGMQIPARFDIDLPSVVNMDFALDRCTVNPK